MPAVAAEAKPLFKAELTLRETYDSNVYIQDAEPLPANVAAARAAGLEPVEAKKESLVTTILPRFSLEYAPAPALSLTAVYSPELNYYHAADSEDYVAHRGQLNLGGKFGDVTWGLNNTAVYIDGSDEGPTFARPGDVPAIGGIPLRDRREAFVFRNAFNVKLPLGKFFVRPVAATYVHEFMTVQRPNPSAAYVYENYIDRRDVNGGVDLGWQVVDKTALVLGYRYGASDQFTLLDVDSPYDSTYHRVLIGIEGTPWPWLKLAVLAGPDIRSFDSQAQATYPSFQDDELLWWVDAAVTILPTAADTITLLNRRYEQPAFSSFSVYEDVTYSLTWKHKFGSHWSVGAGFQLYLGDWQAPVNREDWIWTPSASVGYTSGKFNVEFAYSYDWVDSQVSNTEGREFTRHLVGLSARYSF
jgi:hypothetical protein